MHLIDQINKPIIFAHRGASKYAPENTMAAFDLAYKMGAPAIELDTMLSKDDIPVVIHDHTLDRTTNTSGRVDVKNGEELRCLDAGSSFSKDFAREPIPLLKDVLMKYKGKMLVNIELKNYHAPYNQLAAVVVEMVMELDAGDSVIFSSFLPRNLFKIRKLLPNAKTALLVEKGLEGSLLTSRIFSFISPDFIHPSQDFINVAYLRYEHEHHRQVNTWTVNDLRKARNFIQWGVDGLITNDPKGLLDLKP